MTIYSQTPGYPNPKEKPLKTRCFRCTGSGRAPCEICSGRREVFKGMDRFGRQEYQRCDGCFGVGTRRCARCGGEGWVE